ncbi:MAG TPA: hypothetical protein VK430_04055 [Xanthobacteraceae bacterium]|nr:hypothetical protein [Xanthobacteraceae bacterium]
MPVAPNRKELLLVIYDKLIIAIFVAAVSAMLLYSYNVYSKAFELAEKQSGGYSAIAAKLRDLVMINSVKATQEIKTAYGRGDRYLPKKASNEIASLAIEIRGVAKLLEKPIGKTASSSGTLADALTEASINLAISGAFTRQAVDATNDKIIALQARFIESYNSDIGPLTSNEFRHFFNSFESELPFLLRPVFLLIISVLIFVIGTVAIWVLLREPGKDVNR